MKFKDVTIAIPARYYSKRFPKKPLAIINGKSMIETVYRKSLKLGCKKVFILTDHKKILNHCLKFTNNVVMTKKSIKTGSDRISFFSNKIKTKWILNLQGDEPFFFEPDVKNLIKKTLARKNNFVASTLFFKKKVKRYLINKNECKIVLNNQNEVLYFSRSLIPFSKFTTSTTYLKHIGIYLYKKNFLRKFNKLKHSSLEKNENLEQLRILENGYKILAFQAKKETQGIDIPENLGKVKISFIK